MIVDIFLYILSILIKVLNIILPSISIPTTFTQPFNVVISVLLTFNQFFPVKTILSVVFFIISFEVVFLISRSTVSLFNWLRGSGELKLPLNDKNGNEKIELPLNDK